MTEAQAFLQYIPFDREFKPTKKESQIRPNMIENFEILIQKKTRLIFNQILRPEAMPFIFRG